jgi:hypothetical protein
MCLLCRKWKSKKRQWFPVDEDDERQVPQQESMDLQVVEHEPMQVVDQAMEEVHIVEQVVDEGAEKVHVEEQVVQVQTTPKKVSSVRPQETNTKK